MSCAARARAQRASREDCVMRSGVYAIVKCEVCMYHHLSLLFKNYGLKKICDLFKIKHTEFFYFCIFDLQYTKVLNNGISFYLSNLIRVKFKVN